MSARICWPAQPPPGTHVPVGISQIVPAPQSLSPAHLPGSRQVLAELQNCGATHSGMQVAVTVPPAPLLPWEPLLPPLFELFELPLPVPPHAARITPRKTQPR